MDLRLLPDGPVVRISVDRGAQARGCRLDAGALEQSTVWVSSALETAEFLIVNKFGKQEAEGKGLTSAIADALVRGLPVLVGVNGLNLPAFLEFSAGLALELTPEAAPVTDWCLAALSKKNTATGMTAQNNAPKRRPRPIALVYNIYSRTPAN